jgi:hypothetical protein
MKPSLANPLMAATLLLALSGAALGQEGDRRAETVTWTVSAPEAAAKPGGRLTLKVQGAVQSGWHVYSLKQAEDGPTPLLVKLQANPAATAAGAVTGTAPVRQRDAAFGFDTEFYDKDFVLTVPVRLRANLKPGPQAIPLTVRFQTCNGAVCQPPKTVRLSAAVNLQVPR